MPESRRHWLRRVATSLIRGPHAPFILSDLDEAYERDLAGGVPLWSARLRYGVNVLASAVSTMRPHRWLPNLGASWLDLKLGLRMLVKYPGLTLVSVFALVIGIPVGLLPTHFINSVTRPLPVPDAHEIVTLQNRDLVEADPLRRPLHDLLQWRDELTSYEALGMGRSDPYNVISEDGRAAPVRGAEVTASVFSILRVLPLLGRPLIEEDEVIGAPDVVVIGHDLWQSRLAADPEVVGSTIRIGAVPYTVVGVMPEGFLFPSRDHLWFPLRYNPLDYERGRGPDGWIVGRLAQGVSIAEARVELDLLGERMAADFPETYGRIIPQVLPYTEGVVGIEGEDDTLIRLIQFLAVLLLALACGNVGILILARTATRSAEIAIRTALGASPARLVGQIFVESLLLAVLAVGIGLGVGQIVATTLDAPVDTLPFWTDFRITQDTVVLAMWLAVLSAGIAGVVPALKATGKSVHSSLQRAASGGSGIRFGWASSVLIVAEVTVAVWFLSLGAVMAPSAISEPGGLGIETDQYLYASLRIPRIEPISSQVESYEVEFQGRIRAAHEELARRLAEEPGIGPIAIATRLPGMAHHSRRLEIEGDAASGGARGQFVQTARVDVGYFDALDQPILIGRNFNTDDLRTDRKVVIVNTNFVDKSLGGRNPIGRRVRYAVSTGEEPGPWLEIVGVVGHLGMNGENPEADAGVYEVVAAGDLHPVSFAIRVGNDPESYTPCLRAITTEIDPGAMIQGPQALTGFSTRIDTEWRGGPPS